MLTPTSLIRVLAIAAVMALAMLVSRSAAAAVHRFWRAGYDVERRMAIGLSLLRVIILTAAVAAVGRLLVPWLEDTEPWLIGASVGALLLASLPLLQNILAGFYLVSRGDVREGDRVTVGGVSGVVREVGLGRVRVRDEGGDIALIPNRLFVQDAVAVQRSSGRARVKVRLFHTFDESFSSRDLRQAALLCPYRVVGSPLHLREEGEWVEVEMQTWRPRCHDEVEDYLAEVLERHAG